MKILLKYPEELKRLRIRKGYTQGELGEIVYLSNIRINQLERKENQHVLPKTAVALVDALICEWGDLFAFEE
jgi:transcriptional regulator with XRE-family HTH domain